MDFCISFFLRLCGANRMSLQGNLALGRAVTFSGRIKVEFLSTASKALSNCGLFPPLLLLFHSAHSSSAEVSLVLVHTMLFSSLFGVLSVVSLSPMTVAVEMPATH